MARQCRHLWGLALLGGGLLGACRPTPPQRDMDAAAAPPEAPAAEVAEGAPVLGLQPAAPKQVGEAVQARDYELTLARVERCAPPAWARPAAGKLTLGLFVELKGTTPRAVRVNPLDAQLTQGDEDLTPSFTGCTPDLRAGSVSAGQRAAGYINFEVADGAGRLRFRYGARVLGAEEQPAVFELSLPSPAASP